MNAPKCAVSALLRIDNLLRSGAVPGKICVLCSSTSVGRTFQHLVDLQTPIGNYDMTISTDWVIARNVLLATDSLGMEIPRYPINHIASAALLRRVLSQISGNRYKPPNDPHKYFRQIQDILWNLRYHGISTSQLHESITAGAMADYATKASDLREIYEAWIEHKEALHVFDAADYMYHALSAGDDLQSFPHGLEHLIAPDAHLLSSPALRLLDGLFGRLSAEKGDNALSSTAIKKICSVGPASVDLYFDSVLRALPRCSYPQAVEIARHPDNLATWHIHEEAENKNLPKAVVVSGVGTALGVQTSTCTPCASQAIAAPVGFEYHQRIAVSASDSRNSFSLSAMGIPNKFEPLTAILQLLRSAFDATIQSPLRNSRTVALICKSPAQAREMHTELQHAVWTDKLLQGKYYVHYDSVIYMRDIEEVRLLLAVITILVSNHAFRSPQ
jgi:hypothetical protein